MCHGSVRIKKQTIKHGWYLNDHFPHCLLDQYNSRASRTRRDKNINKVLFFVELFTASLGAFLSLNYFGKIECKGNGVSVTEVRGHRIQGQWVTLKQVKKAYVVNTVFMYETRSLYTRGW